MYGMNALPCPDSMHMPSKCCLDQCTNKLVCHMMGLEQQATALLWDRRELVFFAKKDRPHQRILFLCVCSTTIYWTSGIPPPMLYSWVHLRYNSTPHMSEQFYYEPFFKFLIHCGSLFSCSPYNCEISLSLAQSYIWMRSTKQGHCPRIGVTTFAPTSVSKSEFSDTCSYR